MVEPKILYLRTLRLTLVEEIKTGDITSFLETLAPPVYQEDYDNSGLLVGYPSVPVTGVLISLDATEDIISEAMEHGCNLVVSHHPIIFKNLKNLTGSNYVQRTIVKAIQNNVALYAIHTNLDNVAQGVNAEISSLIGLENTTLLVPGKDTLSKIVTFCPKNATEKVLAALHAAGTGHIGNYTHCSFRVSGHGRFQPGDMAQPHIGKPGHPEQVEEDRLELIFPSHKQHTIVKALQKVHPYEEVAYYCTSLTNPNQEVGAGMTGTLPSPMHQEEFLAHLKKVFNLQVIKYTPIGHPIRKVAVCGGAGSFLLGAARQLQADAFVSADFKYHEYFDAEGDILIADIGHYESEECTKKWLYRNLKQNFTNIALRLSEAMTNPVRYYL